jgi:predicted O-methyltransferase YrrM
MSREAMRGQRQINPLNLANLAWAFASAGWHGEMSTRRIGLRDPKFFEWIAQTAVSTMQQFTPQNCSNLVWAFATMRVSDSNLFDTMAVHVQTWLINDFDPQHLSNTLWSYAKLAIPDADLFEAAATEILRRGLDYLTAKPQNISNTIWAYGTVNIRIPALLDSIDQYITTNNRYYSRLTEVRPLSKSSKAQLAMTVLSLHRLGLDHVAWYLFDRIAADGIQASGEAYSNWLFICGETGDTQREVLVWEQMARSSHTKGLQQAVWNCAVLRSINTNDMQKAQNYLQIMDEQELCNVMSEHLRARVGVSPPRSRVGPIDWRRREKTEHEWVTNALGFSLRLNKIEYYKEVGTLHYILQSEKDNVPNIHKHIETFIQEQELWLKLAGDEKGAVLDACIAMHGRPRIIVEVGLYVGYSSTRMASQMRAWGGRVISMEVDPYHAAISRNTIELAGLTDNIEIWVGHSENLIPRLKTRFPEKSIDMLFFDQQGTKMHTDLDKIIKMNMLSDTAIIVGDNVLRPGSPQFMYWTCAAGPYDTQVISLREYAQDVVEDWMSISFYKSDAAIACGPMTIPESVEQVAHETDGIRWQSVEAKVSEQQWDSHSQRMRREFAKVGIRPYEVQPWQDDRGHSRVTLRPRDSRDWHLDKQTVA